MAFVSNSGACGLHFGNDWSGLTRAQGSKSRGSAVAQKDLRTAVLGKRHY
jgi:hypothetical protein